MSNIHKGQIEELVADGDGVLVRVSGMVVDRHIPGSALTINGNPADVQAVLGWYAAAKGGAYCEMVTDGLLDLQGVSADFRSKP